MLKLAKCTSYILCQANQLPFPLRPQGARPGLCVKNLSSCALSTPRTRKPLKLGSTLFCLIPVNFPHALSIYMLFRWPCIRDFRYPREQQGLHVEGATSMNMYCLGPSLWLMLGYGPVTALTYPGEKRQVFATKDVTQKVEKDDQLKNEPGNSPVNQWLGLCSHCWSPTSISGTKILQAVCCGRVGRTK